jgi:hypothetical protein
VPEHGELPRVALEADKVKDEGVDDFVGQGVLLVEEDADEERRRAGVVHLGEPEEGGARVKNGDADFGDDAADDDGFAEGAGAGLAEREEDALEEGGGLVQSAFERLIGLNAQLLGVGDFLADAVVEDLVEEALALFGIKRRDEDPRRREARMRRPLVGFGEGE